MRSTPPLVGLVLFAFSQLAAAQMGPNPALRAVGGSPPPTSTGPAAPTAMLSSFASHAAWVTSAGGPTTLIDFESVASGTQVTNQLASLGVTNVTGTSIFSTTSSIVVTSSQALPFPFFLPGTLPSETNAISTDPNSPVYACGTITFQLASPATAVGVWVADQSPLANFQVDLADANGSLGSIVVPPQTLPNSFVGVISDTPFTSVTFHPQSDYDSWGLDDLEFSAGNANTFCFGDGTGTLCPCGNAGASGNGCASSVSAAGAHLNGSGSSSISSDSFHLTGTLMPNSSVLFFQGTAETAAGAGSLFGDGLRCAGGTIIRLGAKLNVGGSSIYPTAGNAPISIKGANVAGNVRVYQCWYRNAAAYCTPSTFNLTNGVETTWVP